MTSANGSIPVLDQPPAEKMKLLIDDPMIGDLPLGTSTFRSSTIHRQNAAAE